MTRKRIIAFGKLKMKNGRKNNTKIPIDKEIISGNDLHRKFFTRAVILEIRVEKTTRDPRG